MDALSVASLVFVAFCAVGTVVCCVGVWRSKGRLLVAAASMRATALRWERLDRPDRAAECVAAAERYERQARPRRTAPTSTEGAAT